MNNVNYLCTRERSLGSRLELQVLSNLPALTVSRGYLGNTARHVGWLRLSKFGWIFAAFGVKKVAQGYERKRVKTVNSTVPMALKNSCLLQDPSLDLSENRLKSASRTSRSFQIKEFRNAIAEIRSATPEGETGQYLKRKCEPVRAVGRKSHNIWSQLGCGESVRTCDQLIVALPTE